MSALPPPREGRRASGPRPPAEHGTWARFMGHAAQVACLRGGDGCHRAPPGGRGRTGPATWSTLISTSGRHRHSPHSDAAVFASEWRHGASLAVARTDRGRTSPAPLGRRGAGLDGPVGGAKPSEEGCPSRPRTQHPRTPGRHAPADAYVAIPRNGPYGRGEADLRQRRAAARGILKPPSQAPALVHAP